MKKKNKIPLSRKIIIAIILGIIVGALTGTKFEPYLNILGKIFINLLKMCVVPLVFSSIALGVAEIADLKTFGRVGIKVGLYYIGTTIVAGVVGAAVAMIIKPGMGFVAETTKQVVESRTAPSLGDVIVGFVPSNIVTAMANMDLNSIIFFAIMFGTALVIIGDKKKPVVEVLKSLNTAMIKMVEMCIQFAPIGVFSLMTIVAGKYGLSLIKPLSKFLLSEYISLLILFFPLYGLITHFVTKVNYFDYINRLKDIIIMAISTQSSAATLPLEMEAAQNRLGIPSQLAGFSLPLGATINQNGAAMNIVTCVIFSAQAFGLDMSFADIFTITFLAVIMSTGCAGVPAGASVFTLMILSKFNIPTDAFAMILSIYTLIDMGITAVNVIGDLVCVSAVARSEGVMDMEVWNNYKKVEKAA